MNAIVHGGQLDEAMASYGGGREDWLDLSTGINPWSWPIGEISPDSFTRLPGEKAEHLLLEAARNCYQVRDRDSVIPANGTQALIQLLPHVLNCSNVEIVSPTYGEHALCWKNAGCEVTEIADINCITDNAEIVVIGNPNNPDGRCYNPEQLCRLARELEDRCGTLIVDEAFCDVMPELSLVPSLPDNAIVLRSFGKFFGLAGVRLGFAISNPALEEKLITRIGPWAVSGPALEIGAKAITNLTIIRDV